MKFLRIRIKFSCAPVYIFESENVVHLLFSTRQSLGFTGHIYYSLRKRTWFSQYKSRFFRYLDDKYFELKIFDADDDDYDDSDFDDSDDDDEDDNDK